MANDHLHRSRCFVANFDVPFIVMKSVPDDLLDEPRIKDYRSYGSKIVKKSVNEMSKLFIGVDEASIQHICFTLSASYAAYGEGQLFL